ncbi:MAG: hypothetical protein O9353_03795, partial [Bacteroidia bacterium]|nr:hypothetical protein [Bacteroidia bacterium]
MNFTGQSLLTSNYILSDFELATGPFVNNSIYDFKVNAMIGSTPYLLNGSSTCFGMQACGDPCAPKLSLLNTTVLTQFECSNLPASASIETVPTGAPAFTPQSPICVSDLSYVIPFHATDNSYGIAHAAFSNPKWETATWDGQALFIQRSSTSSPTVKYKQTFTSSLTCAKGIFNIKLHHNGLVPLVPNVDFLVKINGQTLTSMPQYDFNVPNDWRRFSFSGVNFVAGTTYAIEVEFINPQITRIGIDGPVIGCYEETKPCNQADAYNPFPEVEYEDPCVQYALDAAQNENDELYNAYVDSVKNAFVKAYIEKCMGHAVETM